MCTLRKLIIAALAPAAAFALVAGETDHLTVPAPYACEVGYTSRLVTGDSLTIRNQVIYGAPRDPSKPAGTTNMCDPLRVLNHWAIFVEVERQGEIHFDLLQYVRLQPDEKVTIFHSKPGSVLKVMIYGSSAPFVPGATPKTMPPVSATPKPPVAPKAAPTESKPRGRVTI